MNDHIHLQGAEDVRAAARSMQDAAATMQRAAESMRDTVERHRAWADEWLAKFEEIMDRYHVGAP